MPSPFRRSRTEQDERLAGRHRDPHLQVLLLARPVADRERSTNGTLGVVLARDRRAEERHHGVADELLDRAAETLELAAQALPVRSEHRADVLRIELLRARGEADEVGEEHRHDLALLAARLGGAERGAAGEAEPGAVRVVLPADGARQHARV